MDFYKAVKSLYRELEKVDQAIATLEGLINGKVMHPVRRRGRTSMSADERKLVSERMKKYWASRRSGEKQKT